MAKKYLYISENSVLAEIIPDEDPIFHGVEISERFSPEFIAMCVIRTDVQIAEEGIEVGMLYNKESDKFSKPVEPEPKPEPEPEPEPEPGEPTWTERVESLETENKQLTSKLDAAIQSNQMLEDCLVEMAEIVYA